jgi:hypothetical protein
MKQKETVLKGVSNPLSVVGVSHALSSERLPSRSVSFLPVLPLLRAFPRHMSHPQKCANLGFAQQMPFPYCLNRIADGVASVEVAALGIYCAKPPFWANVCDGLMPLDRRRPSRANR